MADLGPTWPGRASSPRPRASPWPPRPGPSWPCRAPIPTGAWPAPWPSSRSVLGRQEQVRIDLDDPGFLPDVRRAAESRRQIRIGYYSASRDETTDRVVDPYHVFSSGGYWYLDAWCHQAGDMRHFRVDRVESVEPTGQTFDPVATPPPDLVVAPGPEAPVAVLRLPARARSLVESLPVRSVTDQPDGGLEVELSVGGEAWLARLLLRAGPGAQVVSPEWRADTGRRAAARILALYR